MNTSRYCSILILAISTVAAYGDGMTSTYSASNADVVQPNDLVAPLADQVVPALPDQIIPPLANQLVRALPGELTKPLTGQIVQSLDGQRVGPLPGQIMRRFVSIPKRHIPKS